METKCNCNAHDTLHDHINTTQHIHYFHSPSLSHITVLRCSTVQYPPLLTWIRTEYDTLMNIITPQQIASLTLSPKEADNISSTCIG